MLHLPLGHSSGLISEPRHPPLFACKRVFHFNDFLIKLSLVRHPLQRELNYLCKAFMLDRFILLNIFTRTIQFAFFPALLVFFWQTTGRTGRKLQEELRALPKAIMPPTAAHNHICQWLWSRCWAATWSRLMAGCRGEGSCFMYTLYTW